MSASPTIHEGRTTAAGNVENTDAHIVKKASDLPQLTLPCLLLYPPPWSTEAPPLALGGVDRVNSPQGLRSPSGAKCSGRGTTARLGSRGLRPGSSSTGPKRQVETPRVGASGAQAPERGPAPMWAKTCVSRGEWEGSPGVEGPDPPGPATFLTVPWVDFLFPLMLCVSHVLTQEKGQKWLKCSACPQPGLHIRHWSGRDQPALPIRLDWRSHHGWK